MGVKNKILSILFSSVAVLSIAQSKTTHHGSTRDSQVHGYWVDPSTGLMWTGRDNERDVSWKKATNYCRDLRLAGYSDWRLATIAELEGIYDKNANAPGLDGQGVSTWHVKGNLFLTGREWSSERRMDDRGRPSGYAWYFNFNEGETNNDQIGYSAVKRALCVRGSEE